MSTATSTPSPAVLLAHKVVVVLLPILVLLQAALAGQHVYNAQDLIVIHGHIGNTAFILTLLGVPLALKVRKGDGLAFGLAVALVALTFAQIGLGYVGRETIEARAYHIPLGVLILGLASFQLSMLRPSPR